MAIDLKTFHQRIDHHSPTWMAVEEYLNHRIKELHETLEVPRGTELERIDQGKIRLCRDLLDAAKPSRPDGERSAEAGIDYGMQGI